MKKILSALLALVCLAGCAFAPAPRMSAGLLAVNQSPGVNSPVSSINKLPELKRPADWQKEKAYREENAIPPALSDAVNNFSWATAKAILSGKTENSMYSPLSLYIPLSLAAMGANGTTYKEMAAMLGIRNQTNAQFTEDMGKLYRLSYMNTKDSKLSIANSLWLREGTELKKSFVTRATNNYYATLHPVDFSKKSAGRQMSDWVSEHTDKLITPEIKPSKDTLLAIINTVYFKAGWYEPFAEYKTKPQVFYPADGETVQCDFMNKSIDGGPYLETNQFLSTFLSFSGGSKMHFVLPKKGVKLDSILSNPATLRSIVDINTHSNGVVNLALPKFSFATSYGDIIEKMQALGIKQAFTDDANFSRMTDKPVFITDIKHQTKITLNEKGVEAAAYTQIEMGESAFDSSEMKTVNITLDRPFLFIITSDFGAPLFIGVCNNPLAE